MIALRVKSL